ncbi:MAG: cadherin-like domain-containing protein [Candidatus Dojkabacteria bacterium]|nr:cadherin-like domain-containing protein [Candidatus Dojkabacteria bacterium]
MNGSVQIESITIGDVEIKIGSPTNITLETGETVAILVSKNGDVSIVTPENFNGDIGTITVSLAGGTSFTATTSAAAVNDAPEALSPTIPFEIEEDYSSDFTDFAQLPNVLDNFTDVDGDNLNVAAVYINNEWHYLDQTGYTFIPVNDSADNTVIAGTLAIASDGSTWFDPAQDYNGTPEMPRVYVGDGNGEYDSTLLDITVTPVNDAP